jgi:hypothetical protein
MLIAAVTAPAAAAGSRATGIWGNATPTLSTTVGLRRRRARLEVSSALRRRLERFFGKHIYRSGNP